MKTRILRSSPIAGLILVVSVVALVVLQGERAPSAAQDQKPLEEPPKDQTYVGTKNCASCHFEQYLDWRQTKHAKAFDILPAKYRNDASCLKCHTTGHGEPSGYSGAATPDLVAVTCESCHGPANKHGEIAKTFGNKKLTEAEEAYVRSTVHKMQPRNVCVDCHLTRAHKKHPPYDK